MIQLSGQIVAGERIDRVISMVNGREDIKLLSHGLILEVSNVLLWNRTHGHTRVGRQTKT